MPCTGRAGKWELGFQPAWLCAFALALAVGAGLAQAQALDPKAGRPLVLNQTRYRLRAGERIVLDAPAETLDFVRSAKSRTAAIRGAKGRGFAIGPTRKGDQILLAASLTTKPGEYTVSVSAVSQSGEVRAEAIDVVLDPPKTVPSTATAPPVVLLNGWQIGISNDGCPPSTAADTFGNTINHYLGNAPVVYFFDNCVEDQNGLIEDLGSTLGEVLNLIQYDTGGLVPQVDLIAHSMGGLIVRSYLAGLQSGGTIKPLVNPRVRKFIQIATPNFGSFQATDLLGPQTAEMIPGSPLLWNLATWNQRGDDLRGVDALAIVGNAGTFGDLSNASDGVVSLTSASLGFADQSRTRILPYCHIDTNFGTSLEGFAAWLADKVTCHGNGIANVDEAPQTGQLIQYFLSNNTDWMSVGTTPSTDPWLSQYGGIYFAEQTASAQWITSAIAQISFGTVPLADGGASGTVFYGEFLKGTGTFTDETNSSFGACGPFSEPTGYYTVVRCKYSPQIYSVGPLSSGAPGRVVQSGGAISVSGVGFGQQCSSCEVYAYPGPVALQVSSWTDSAISAFLPATFNNELVQLLVETASGSDEINIMAQASPMISLSPSQLHFSYTVGGAAPAPQTVVVSSSGGGTLTWTATSSVSWLTLASGEWLTVSASPSGLSPNTYTGTITITAAGASNSPQIISVTLTVTAPPTAAPSISLSATQANFTYTVGGAAPAPQSISISNSGAGTLTWSASTNASWLASTPSGTAPSTLTISVTPASLTPGPYQGAITITATGASNGTQTLSVSLIVTAAASGVVVTSVTNSASGGSGAIAPGEIVTIKGNGLGPAAGVSFSVDPSTGMVDTTLSGTRVLFGSFVSPITYTSAGQINAIVPYEIAGQSTVVMRVQYQGAMSAGTTLQVASAAPGAFTFSGTGSGQAVAANQDGSLNGASNPAAPGSYVTIYFTGGGETNPPGVTGSVTGAVLKWLTGAVSVTVGNVPATVAFEGAAPTFVDGLGQLNIQLANNTPAGVEPLVITVGGLSSPATATISVQ